MAGGEGGLGATQKGSPGCSVALRDKGYVDATKCLATDPVKDTPTGKPTWLGKLIKEVPLNLNLIASETHQPPLIKKKRKKFFYRADIFDMLFICYCSVAQLCPTLCHPMDCSMPSFLVLPYLLEFTQTHVHWVIDAIQPSRPLSSPSPPAFNLPQHQCLFQWVGSLHQVAKVLDLQLHNQSFQWIFSIDFL